MRKHYDFIVVGSGASGSFAAKELTERGLDVLLLEAGRPVSEVDFPTNFAGPKEKGIALLARARAALTGQPLQSRVAFYGPQQRHLFVNDREHPYSTPKGKPFLWIRGKQLGGRLHTFGRVLLRWSDVDFKAASRDGYGQDWPISYADLEPYYGKVEQILGVRGCPDGIANIPDGKFAGPSKLTGPEEDFKTRTEQKWSGRRLIPWRYMPPNAKRIPQPILDGMATGRLTIRTDAVVRRIVTDPGSGKATGVEFADRENLGVEVVSGRAVMVCASAIESVRLLLNSAGGKHPQGLGNSSGMLGRYFMDQVPSMIMGTVPNRSGSEVADDVPMDPFYGNSGGVYIPRYENLASRTNPDFIRGFGYQGTIGRLYVPQEKPARYAFMGFGEMLPQHENRITLHPHRKDRWGVPIPHIACVMGPNETAMLKEQLRSAREMALNAGLEMEFSGSALGIQEEGRGAFPDSDCFSRLLFRKNFRSAMSLGAAIHESGGVRMGNDPATSVLNQWNQCWDASNVFVTDASSFVTGGCAGTTLTLMALTVRASENAAKQLATGLL